MQINEVRELNNVELHRELEDQQRGLMNLRFRKATMQLTNTNELAAARKTIARIKTVIRERQITASLEAQTTTIEDKGE